MSQIDPETRARVIAAADALAKELGGKNPKVEDVRRAAGVGMDAASTVMKEWRQRRRAPNPPPPQEVPPPVAETAKGAIAAIWEAANAEAARQVERIRAQAEEEAREAEVMRSEISAAADAAADEIEVARKRITELENALSSARAESFAQRERLAVLESSLANAKSDLEEARRQVRTESARAERAEAVEREVKQEASEARQSARTAAEQAAALGAAAEAAAEAQKASLAKIGVLEGEIRALASERAGISERLDATQKQLLSEQNQGQKLATDLAAATKKMASLEGQVEAAKAAAVEAKADAKTARELERAARDEAAELRGALRQAQSKK